MTRTRTAPFTISIRPGICHTVAKRLAFPNGIVIRPGGKELLVGRKQPEPDLEVPGARARKAR